MQYMRKRSFQNKKGLSDVITTVLIILLAIVAVGIIGTVILKNLGKGEEKLNVIQSCQNIELTPIRCDNSDKTVVVRRNSVFGADSAVISKVRLIFLNSATKVTYPISVSGGPSVGESSSMIWTAYPAGLTDVTNYEVNVAAIVESPDGTDYTCEPGKVKITCLA